MMSERQNRYLLCRDPERTRRLRCAIGTLSAVAWLLGCGDADEGSQSNTRGGVGGRARPAVLGTSASGGTVKTGQATGGARATSTSAASASTGNASGGASAHASSGASAHAGGASASSAPDGTASVHFGGGVSSGEHDQGGAPVHLGGGNGASQTTSSTSFAGSSEAHTSAGFGGNLGFGGVPTAAGASNLVAVAGTAGTLTRPSQGQTCDGYTLLGMPSMSNGTPSPARLIDMNGQVVHTWTIGGFPPKMLPGGALIGCVGVIGTYDCVDLQQVTWDGALEWSFSNWVNPAGTPASRQHHDLQREGNPVGYYSPGQAFVAQGKTLVLAHQGRTVSALRDKTILDDVIYEVNWAGEVTGDFKWFAADHIDQFGFDESARIHIRTTAPNTALLEWLHGNSVSRLGPNHWFDEGHPEFHPDNIIYSSRDANFVIIISHETGDVVWRIGPDFAGNPEEKLGQFAGQHHAHVIPWGLPGAGNILVFDNGGASGYGGTTAPSAAPTRYSRSYSRVLEFDPITMDIVWQYGDGSNENFYSQLISSAQRLPNGNTLIAIGQKGQVLEITRSRQIVWQYQQLSTAGAAAPTYRAYRVPPEWLPAGVNEALGNYPAWSSLYPSGS